jgi:hypothetical protein
MPLLAAAALLAGCGSNGPLTTGELRADATHVCTSADAHMDAIPTPPTPAGAAAFLTRGITVLRPELAQLRSLKPTDSIAQAYGTSLSAFSRKLDALTTTVRRIDSGGDALRQLEALQHRLAPLESTENRAWKALQIPACVNR